jgi:hypothetical protein
MVAQAANLADLSARNVPITVFVEKMQIYLISGRTSGQQIDRSRRAPPDTEDITQTTSTKRSPESCATK